ncbi:MAG TPA: alkaline phosphatase family protein [Terriglobales bacterium]|nr:alkaline phosphatase family protein [Terriglobales bacterium]
MQQYFDIATNYGFANYMFQTNEGPSFPAHQFILSGTSAPLPPPNLNFVAENASFYDSGCPHPESTPFLVDPAGNETTQPDDCYTHKTLVDQLDANHVTWRYYTPTQDVIWDAPAAISGICGTVVNGNCTGSDFINNVIWPGKNHTSLIPAIPFLQDVISCNLQAVSWVIPDAQFSDHPDTGSLGPSYVANLVDAIGKATTCDKGAGYWSDTAIFITWDDWGGWFDHVPPPAFYRGTDNPPTCPSNLIPNGWGCGYVYGFRVPLLVVSAYTQAGYVSGAISGTTTYPPPKQYTHDSGSILAFIENNFGLKNIAYPDLYYADYNAIDWLPDRSNIPLSDFFPGPYRSFTPISPASGYDANYFLNYYTNHNATPQGPDGDDAD